MMMEMMMKMLTWMSRVLVGALFIVSGLIKANDPLGFSYKLNDYFAGDVLNMPWLDPWALELSIFICIAEIILGVAILLGSKSRLASWSLLLMIVFFTFLTFYSAYYNKVTDCGCFGDALKLTPWQSFSKDVVLLFFILIIFIRQKKIEPNTLRQDYIVLPMALILIAMFSFGVISWGFPVWFSLVLFAVLVLMKMFIKSKQIDWILAGATTIICTSFSIYCYQHLPIRDFRPYAVGKSIPDQIECPPDAPKSIYKDTWYYKVNGEVGEYTTQEAPWNIEGAEFVDRKTVLVKKGCEPPIHDFVLEDQDANDYTEDVLAEPYILLLVSYDITKANEEVQPKVNALVEASNNDGGPYFYGLSASLHEEVDAFRHKHQSAFDYLTVDGTALKTIVRSNPGLVLLKEGTVVGKWHHNDFPSYEELKANYLK